MPDTRTFFIAAVPMRLGCDGSDDLLDPHRGFRLSARVSPEVSLQSGQSGYVRSQIDGSAYIPLGSDKVVLAGRIRFGQITGARSEEHTSELQSLMRISYAVFCLKKQNEKT